MLMSTATCNAKAWLFGKGRQHYDGTISSGRHYLFGPSRHSDDESQNGGTVQIGAENYSLVRTAARGREDFVACSRKDPGYPIWKRDFTGASAFVRCQVERQHS